jgi:hypothetical protein
MTAAVCQTLGGDRPEVLDVVGDDRSLLDGCQVDYLAVRCLRQVGSLPDGLDIQSPLPQDSCYSGRELLVEQRLHEASASFPASQAAYPRSHSA